MGDIDPGEAHQYLIDYRSHFAAPQEAINYVNAAMRRFLITLDMVPPSGQGQRLLELGAGPYYITLLLKKYRDYDLELANFFGDAVPAVSEQSVRSEQRREEHTFRFRNFNCERDPFPYPDESFDFVLCCEILEHLTTDPTHMLCEIHRVLKPNGQLLVTTPNVLNMKYWLRLLRGSGNVFHPYSGYGVYGRHQREYMLSELTDLLKGVGYDIVEARLADIYPSPRWEMPLKRIRPEWRDNLFVLAQKSKPRRYYYPVYLYVAYQSIRRVVSSDVRIGWNDVGHIGSGWWELEQAEDAAWRWTAKSAQISLQRPTAAQVVRVEVNSGPAAWGPTRLRLEASTGEHSEVLLEPDKWQEVDLPLAQVLRNQSRFR